MGESLLVAEGVVAGYVTTPVVGPISFAVERGQPVALLGPNGAGKTTLLRAILGEARVLSGSLRRSLGMRLAVVPQQALLDPLLPTTVGEFLSLAAGSDRAARQRLDPLAQEWQLRTLWRTGVRDCSGGQRQRVLVVRALLRSPDLLLLDEPSTALDTATRAQLIGDVQRLAPDHGILLVTHDEALVAALGALVIPVGMLQ